MSADSGVRAGISAAHRRREDAVHGLERRRARPEQLIRVGRADIARARRRSRSQLSGSYVTPYFHVVTLPLVL